jgi:RecA-family ATPase
MQTLKRACSKYRLAVIFLHHITKSSEGSGKLNKSNSNGSHAIEAKSRLMIEMKKKTIGLPSSVELGIVKGNDVDEKYKSSAKTLNIQLNPDTLWFGILKNMEPILHENKKINWKDVFGKNMVLKTNMCIREFARRQMTVGVNGFVS